jgi:H+/Cl- antiporter ClcA
MINRLRFQDTSPVSGLIKMSLAGAVCGLLSGGIIVLFRLLVESVQGQMLPGGDPENYEQLPVWVMFVLPAVGGLILGVLFQQIAPHKRQVGVVHTFERLAYHQARLPLINAVMQFIGAAISIISGHSVGREGPSIHLGAAAGSLFGRMVQLNNNNVRTLVACGISAAIAASFNTPIAGVVFTLEVVMLQYSLASLTPVFIATVVATVLSRSLFGEEPILRIQGLGVITSPEMPWVIVTGLIAGMLAVLFIRSLVFFTELRNDWPIWLRMTIGGMLVGLVAMAVPEVMSIGYDTVVDALHGEIIVGVLVLIVFAKIIATTIGLGFGLPGGLIGPTIFIGACAGGAMGLFGHLLFPQYIAHEGLYAMIGMGAMMGATLQAPLAAILAIFELTHDPYIILPGMLAIIAATIMMSQVFKQRSVFVSLLGVRGLDYHDDNISQHLREVNVATIMDRNFVILQHNSERSLIEDKLASRPKWILISRDNSFVSIIPAVDMIRFLQTHQDEKVPLMHIPARHLDITAIDYQSSLQDAMLAMAESGADSAYVERWFPGDVRMVYGILTWEDISAFRVGNETVAKLEREQVGEEESTK